jgi:uncharacterized membrane protein YdjX (TVP38/TMEM64 family)
MSQKKIFFILLGVIALIAINISGVSDALTLSALKAKQSELQLAYKNSPLAFMSAYFLLYILTTAFSIPGATILTLAGAAVFGFMRSLLLVSFASTIGASLAMLGSRYLFRDWVTKKFGEQLESVYKGLRESGGLYLASLRLMPIFPFFLINLLFGVTEMSLFKYFWISQLAMLPGTLLYINAGTQLEKIQGLHDIMQPQVFVSFLLIGLFPLLVKKVLKATSKST